MLHVTRPRFDRLTDRTPTLKLQDEYTKARLGRGVPETIGLLCATLDENIMTVWTMILTPNGPYIIGHSGITSITSINSMLVR